MRLQKSNFVTGKCDKSIQTIDIYRFYYFYIGVTDSDRRDVDKKEYFSD